MLPKIISVIPLPNYMLQVEFESKVQKLFSVWPYLKYTVYQPLENVSFFNSVSVKYDTVVWGKDEEIDFDPITVYSEGETV
jgi:hypothetical protein